VQSQRKKQNQKLPWLYSMCSHGSSSCRYVISAPHGKIQPMIPPLSRKWRLVLLEINRELFVHCLTFSLYDESTKSTDSA
jgi:hypothetical protein